VSFLLKSPAGISHSPITMRSRYSGDHESKVMCERPPAGRDIYLCFALSGSRFAAGSPPFQGGELLTVPLIEGDSRTERASPTGRSINKEPAGGRSHTALKPTFCVKPS